MARLGNQVGGVSCRSEPGGWTAHWVFAFGVMAGAALLLWPGLSSLDAAPQAAGLGPIPQSYPVVPAAPSLPSQVIAPLAGPEQPRLQLTATLGRGDTFAAMLQRAGIGAGDAQRAAALVAAETPLARLHGSTPVAITLGRRDSVTVPRPLERLSLRPRLDLALIIERRNGALTVTRERIAVEETRVRVRGIAGASLYRSARAAGVPASAAQQYLRAIDQRLEVGRDLLPSDEFDMVIVRRRAATGESEAGELLYAGLERMGRPLAQLVRWGDERHFFDASGEGSLASSPALPVAGQITSAFGPRRHPILGFRRMHSGIDIRAPFGAPVHAASSGTVAYAGWHGGHGRFVRLAHGGGVGSGYAHLSRIVVAPGMAVRRGDLIGFVGSSGLSTGPHLHYEFYRGGRPVDPASFRFISPVRLDSGELSALRSRLAEFRRLKPGLYRGA